MIAGRSFQIRIEIGAGSGMFTCVISQRLMKILSIDDASSARKRWDKVLNLSDAIRRKSLDHVHEFLPLHGRNFITTIMA